MNSSNVSVPCIFEGSFVEKSRTLIDLADPGEENLERQIRDAREWDPTGDRTVLLV